MPVPPRQAYHLARVDPHVVRGRRSRWLAGVGAHPVTLPRRNVPRNDRTRIVTPSRCHSQSQEASRRGSSRGPGAWGRSSAPWSTRTSSTSTCTAPAPIAFTRHGHIHARDGRPTVRRMEPGAGHGGRVAVRVVPRSADGPVARARDRFGPLRPHPLLGGAHSNSRHGSRMQNGWSRSRLGL